MGAAARSHRGGVGRLREYLPALRRLPARVAPDVQEPERAEVAEPAVIRVGVLIRAARADAKRRSLFRVEALEEGRSALLREVWRSGGVWVESKRAARERSGRRDEAIVPTEPRSAPAPPSGAGTDS